MHLSLVTLFCEYISSQEILNIIRDYELSSQEKKYTINKKIINKRRCEEIIGKNIFEFPEDTYLVEGDKIDLYNLSYNKSDYTIYKRLH